MSRKILVKNFDGVFVEGTLKKDDNFCGGWKVVHENCIQSIEIATIKEVDIMSELGFFDTGQRKHYYPLKLRNITHDDLKEVEIVRVIPFFYVGQKKLWVQRLKKFYTDEAIMLLEHDGYIKILDEEKPEKVKKVKKDKKK